MALIDYESFDNLGSLTALGMKGWFWGGNSPQLGTYGRFGTDGIREADNSVVFGKVYQGLNQQVGIMGCAVSLGNSGGGGIMAFYEAAIGYQITLRNNGSNRLEVRRGAQNGIPFGTGTMDFLPGIYYHVEMKVTIDNAVGAVEVRVNGVPDIALTNVDTQATANAYWSEIVLGSQSASNRCSFDDFYLLDGTGPAPYNDFLGDCRVASLLPSGNGNSSQFVGSDGNSVDNYLLVDEPGAASSVDYVQSGTIGDKDTYAFANLTSAAGSVHAVKPVLVAKKDDAGARSIASVARLGGVEVDSTGQALSTSDTWLTDIRTTKPGGGNWTIADVNNAEFGIKVTA